MAVSYLTKITDEEIQKLPLFKYEGIVKVIDELEDAEAICNVLASHKVLGFDTETKPNFVKGSKNEVCILQISTTYSSYIFRLKKLGLPKSLINLLSNSNITKVGVAIKEDLRQLTNIECFEPKGFVDLQSIVGKYGIEDKGLKNLTAIVLKRRISKSQRTSNWENAMLTEAQINYAAIDSWVCLHIWKQLQNTTK